MEGRRIPWLLLLVNAQILGICLTLTSSLGYQFCYGELPCPLCVLQRVAMLLSTIGPATVI